MKVYGKFTDMFKYIIKRTNVLRNIFFSLTLTTLGVSNAWAQGTDYSGVYYIGSVNYNAAKTTTNYYLCPTEEWCYYKAENDFWPNTTEEENKTMPFLTTYQCRNGEYDASKAVWVISKAPNSDYYYIKQKSTDRYLVANGIIRTTSSGWDRMRVHLEEIADPVAAGDKVLFDIYDVSTYKVIQAMGIDEPASGYHDGHSNHKWLTVNNGNYNFLTGQNGKTGGPTGYTNTAGIVGIFTEGDANAKFYLEDYIQKPTIFYNTDNQIQITVQADATIIYTTDGSDPTNSNGTKVNSTTTNFTIDEIKTIKAVAVVEGFLSKEIAVFTPPVLLGNTYKYLIQSQNNAWNTTDFHFYMVPGDLDNNNIRRVNTTSLYRPSMEWYFMGAGEENGFQHYYVVNANGKYLRCEGKGNVYLGDYDSSNDNKFKFRLVESPTAGTYNIYPYGLNILINKNSSNTTNNIINTADYNATNANHGNTRWKFVLPSALDTEAPFTVSDNTKASYYKIGNVGASGYYMIPPTGAGNATVSNSADAEVVKTMNWYFEEVSAPTTSPVETGYYHIRNAVTGDYLYFTKDKNNDGACLATSSTITTGNEDRYQFIWAKTADENVNYYIIPKLLKDASLNQFSSLRKHDSNTSIITNTTRGAGNFAWTFVSTPFCLDPVITQAVNREVTITCPTPGVTIYYTTDGSDPTTSSTLYEGPFVPADNVDINQIKAIAVNVNDNNAQSEIVTFALPKYTYHIVNVSKGIAASSSAIQHAAGTALSGYASIPEALRSPYISDETITFYTMEGEFNAANLNDEHEITATPANSADIYVTYTTTKLEEKFVKLSGSSPFNLKNTSSQFLYDNNGTMGEETNATDYLTTRQHLWYFYGSDPYNIQIKNAATGKYLSTTGSNQTLSADPVTFFLTSQSGEDASFRTITLQNLSNSETTTLTANTVVLPVHYKLIDRSGYVIEDNINYVSAEGFGLPAAWRSPLATYHYWNADAFVDVTTETLTLKTEPAPMEITSATETTEDNTIYVTYDVNDLIDLDGRDLLNLRGGAGGTTYMLQFSGGENFYQEDGSDGVMTAQRKAVYPYNNGDATLYVYGSERWETQLASGASTRTRWLWYLEPSTSKLDPYHVRVSSYQTQTSYKVSDSETRNFHSYLRTYKPDDYSEIVTGVTNDNPLVTGGSASAVANNSQATEYMILGTSLNNLKLQTVEKIDGDRHVVNSFEQYWKNSPTVQNKLSTKVTTRGRNVTLSSAQKAELPAGWHTYQAWANSAPWVDNDDAAGGKAPTTSKKFLNEEHVFQTISMGDGSFQLVATELKPMLILLDQHGWEIVRLPLPSGPDDPNRATRYADLHKYSSPMVARYHYWKTGNKVPGYHKFTVSDPATVSDTDDTPYTSDELGRADLSSSTPNLPDYGTQAIVAGRERDWYVTYDVKPEYANTYAGAATQGATSASPFLVKQGNSYASISGNNALSPTDATGGLDNVPLTMQWYLRPNFNIDHEMGYLYEGETGAQEGVLSQKDTEAENYEAGMNGFDPYNLQIQSVATTTRYFTANTTASELVGSYWSGTSSAVTLENMGEKQVGVSGHDNTQMHVTNATFMVLDDGAGNMRLVPRFDHTKVMQSFTTLSAPAAPNTANQIVTFTMVPQVAHRSSQISAMGGHYVLASDFVIDASVGTAAAPFKGVIDGQLYSFSASTPLVNYAEDATIKNVIIENASVSSGNADGDAGAIVATAKGNTRVYNCGVNSGSVSGSRHVGSIVGHIEGYSRVINCYSFANITGGTNVGGIVGYNDYASSAANIRTMVMNCMFYGDITGGSNASPVYGGYNITNLSSENGLNTFNYYAYEKLKSTTIADNKYNCALAVKDEYLNRFEFYRLLLNSNKKLAAYYASTSTTTVQPSDMAKWVLETADRDIATPKPYPVLKAQGRYPSIINYDVENVPTISLVNGRPTEEDRNKGGNLGTLSVTISGTGTNAPSGASITNGSLTLTRTDKDPAHFNFNYDKVQLPYYNDVGEGNYTENRVVTGWKIISMSPTPASDPYTSANYPASGVTDYPNHNYADRKSVNKDLNSVSGRIFSQGAYFDVPYGVTSITIEPYWGKAAYVADEYLDVTYGTKDNYGDKINRLDKQVTVGTTLFHGQRIEITIDNALKYINNSLGGYGSTVYDNVVVLVGNLHQSGVPSGGDTPFTVMSVDEDEDNEPDYSMIYHHNGRTVISPIRFDFLNIPGTAQAQKPNGASKFYNFTIFKTKGWFETTNTCLVYSNQVEYENKDNVGTKQDAPLILLGGDFEQFVSTQSNTVDGHTTYIHVGSNVRIQSFGLGTHGDGSQSTPHIPVSVTGGEYKEFYLSGTYNQDAKVRAGDNAECYISGGYFEEAAGASQEKIDGSVTWQIYEADMDAFYGGGVNAAKPITGDVTVYIFNSHVTLYCGGPKFGDMQSGKNVTTNAEGCTFTKFFGGGFGGTSYSRKKYYDVAGAGSWSNWAGKYTDDRGKYFDGASTNSKNGGGNDAQYGKKGIGVATDVDYEFFAWSSGQTGGRFYVNFASFSLAACNDVDSNLKGCTINENFYGGGSYGEVKGKATSVLDGCTVHGNVFGGGFSATLPTVKVRKTPAFTTNPKINNYSGMFEPGVLAGFEETEFEWKKASDYGVTLTNGNSGSDLVNHYLYTDVDLTALGKVGSTDLTIKGSTLVEGKIFNSDGSVKETTGGVFGGGDMSAVNHDTQVNIVATGTNGVLNVFGGGNAADVDGNTEVNMTSGTVLEGIYGGCNAQGAIGGDAVVTLTGGTVGSDWGETPPSTLPDRVFGGGLGEPTLVNGNVTVSVGTKSDAEPPVYAGTATVWGNVYGGSALGNTNATRPADDLVVDATKKTNVYLYSGTIHGDAYGGGLGQKNGVNGATSDVVSLVGGDVYVLLDSAKVHRIFGANNLNGTPKGHVTVHVKRTNNFDDAKNALKNNSATELADRGKDGEGVRCYDVEAVYGGGNQADYVPTDALIVLDPNDPEYATKKEKFEKAFAEVLIEGCDATSIEYVYGGGNAAAAPATEVTVNSAYIIDQLFGGGNGAGAGNPGADVGVIDKAAYEADNANGRYGTGIAKTKLIGGQVHVIYGGSNERGNVVGGTTLERKESNSCALKVGEIYGAGQVAPMDGDVNIELDCMPEEFVEAVYGGAKNATINGNVSLTVRSGKFGRVFGGNDQGGSINGSITVNVYEGGCEPLIIGELYGGGYNAPYSIWGCNDDDEDGTWTPNAPDPEGTPHVAADADAIQVNVYSCTSIGRVFGGGFGETADVVGNTHVWINEQKGFVKDVEQDHIGKIAQVFGGGYAASLKGNVTVEIGTATSETLPLGVNIISGTEANKENGYLLPTENAFTTLEAGIYGGGMDADVDGSTTLVIGTVNQPLGVNIAGNIFGGGLGAGTKVTGDVEVNIGKRENTAAEGDPVYTYEGYANITGDVYGGSAMGTVNAWLNDGDLDHTEGKGTVVNLYGGTITGSLYGGGFGKDLEGTEDDHAADVYGPVTVNVEGGKVTNVFGSNNVLGTPKRDVTVNIHGTSVPEAPATYAIENVYGGGNQAAYSGTGGVRVNMSGGVVNDVYGGGLGTTATVNGATTVTLDGGTVKHDVYGGGSQGNVTEAVTVALNGGTVEHDVYGGGALALTNTAYDGANETYRTYVTNVNLAGSTVTGSVYGGGLGQLATPAVLYTAEDAEVIAGTKNVDDVKTPAVEAVAANVNGPVTVTVTGGKAANVFGCNNIYGAPKQTVAVTVNGTTVPVMPATYAIDNVYGGGNQAAYTGTPTVTMAGGYVNNVYGGGLGSTAVIGGTSVIVSGGTVTNDVYGGGSQADVTGNVNVSITGGTVKNDVYGGGALANTNTANWDAEGNTWAEGKNSASNTTSVTLTGGTVGNVYGGGLGAHAVGTTAAIEPKVYGDIAVTVNPEIEEGVYGTARFLRALETHEYEGTYLDAENVEHTQITTGTVYTKGCVFGANNKEGTPKGNIQVTVYSTTPAEGAERQYGIYEIQNVYGGGNLSAYEPADGKTTHVDIHGCDRTSIQFVFGGGNAASVPETNVTIWGSYEIETVFGGGNGSEPFWDRAEEKWVVSPGAAVTTSNVFLKGGYIHSAFGGSYERGAVGTTNIDKSGNGGECELRVTDLFGGGKDADVVGGITITISDCSGFGELVEEGQSALYIKNVYAGSYNARVLGDVNMTVTSGNFTNVFGGNHTSGFINGTITINIEETEKCKPVIIENLYGGGNFAHYPGPGANYADPKITINVKAATRIGNIYGGCNHANVTGDTEVNINMIKGWWAGKTYNEEAIPNSIGTIGNVYGGGNEGKVIGNTTVNIGTEKEIELVSTPQIDDETSTVPPHMVAKSNGKYDVLGAHITGNVYGGCNLDHVTGNTTVNICTADYSTPPPTGFEGVNIDNGSVYGGGNAGDVLGNTNVTMAGGYVYDGVYGGGLHGSVGTFTRSLPSGHPAHAGCIGGKPDVFTPNTGKCTVVVSGGQVGPVEVATEGMKKAGGPIHKGFVFGAGRGDVENPADDPDADFHTYVYETDVTIKNKYEDGYEGGATDSLSHIAAKPLIMASVYGGGENGRVRGNTFVRIYGGQIGCGENKVEAGKPVAYDEADFIDPTTSTASALIAKADEMKECAHWDYGRDKNGDGQKEYLPYDPYAAASDLDDAIVGSDGHTYYGSVFGGGSGYYPYRRSDGTHEWLRSAGIIEGNTKVHISGGHILTNVYGGNELTDVNGSCTVTMTGGTIGIPRTLASIADHPVTCYLFGAGKGDQRTHFNQWTDVASTSVTVSGGIIYGSVFGGGEDGHIVGDAVVNIQGSAKIGTWGTSYVDGNIFGGGRGFSGEALTAGNVGGNVVVNISGGIMLGSIYGGGRLASVGYQLVQPESEYYGKLQDGTDHGYVNINISGGTIGNPYEFIIPSTADNAACEITEADITKWTAADWTKWKTYKNIPYTEFVLDKGLELYRLTHTKGGNVFAGGMGRLDNLNGTPLAGWKELGKVKNTTLNITGGNIKGNVYGGGEMGLVGDIPAGAVAYAEQPVVSTVTISGGGTIIGTEVQSASVTQYTFGSVFGGGYGNTREKINPAVADIPQDESDNPKFMSGRTHGSTQVSMSAGTVLGSIYGGGEVANVRGNASVAISGGTVGKDKVGEKYFSGATMGNVFGGGSGTRTIVRCGQVFGNTSVNISQANPGTPTRIYHNIYGGGSYGSVGDINWTEAQDPNYGNAYKTTGVDGIKTAGTGTATVRVTGGTIGVDGLENGFVFGSSRGEVADPALRDNLMAWTYATDVTIGTDGSGTVTSTPLVKGSVYGGGENGHVWNATDVKVYSGMIGDPDPTSFVVNRGNVFGAGRGIEKYDSNDPDVIPESYNPEAGIVKGSTQVLIAGGQVSHNVYGAGAMGSVVGSTSVTVNGDAVIGDNLDNGTNDGNVFGAARGDIALNSPLNLAYVGSTTVTIAGGLVKNNVFGGGEAGVVKGSVVVNMNGGTVGKNLYGGGALSNTNTNNVTANYGADTGYTNPTETIPTTNTNTTTVNLLGGDIKGNAYGGGLGRRPLDAVGTPGDPGYKPAVEAIFAKVYGDVTVDLNNNNDGGTADGSKAGCAVTKVFGCNDMHGTPRGHVKVHVFATQHPNRTKHATISSKYPLYANIDDYTISNYAGLTTLAATVGADVSAYTAILTDPAKDDDAKEAALADMREAISEKKYDVQAVYGGGDLARYEPVSAFSTDEAVRQSARVEVIIDGCALTSIHEVYGSGNASATPASSLTVYGCHEIDELFGGGNGKDPYQLDDGFWYANPGANVGYRNFTHYVKDGTHGDGSKGNPYTTVENTDATSKEYRIANYAYGSGEAHTDVFGGRIHSAYGGSNMVGNIRFLAMSSYDSSSDCPSNIDHTYAGGNKADMDGKAELLAKCVGYMHKLYGGNTNADYNNDILMTITNGVFGTVIGGNDQGGKVSGSITINIKEGGCNPIIIDKLYGGGYEAGYSIYGYNKSDGSPRTKEDYDRDRAAALDTIPEKDKDNETVINNALIKAGLFGFPKASPRINIISATKIGEVYGGGYNSVVVGNPTINVNMEEGQVLKEYVDKNPSAFTNGKHTLTTSYHEDGIDVERNDDYAVVGSVAEGLAAGNAILKTGTIGTIFGGGDQADVIGNTTVEIGTGSWFNPDTHLTESVERKAAFVLGNVYGGGRMGNVGNFTKTAGKPISCVDGTGIARVVISNGEIGPDNMKMYHADGSGVIPAADKPDDSGHVFGGGMGTNAPADDNAAFVDSTEVIINGTAWVKGSVFGGGENGHVLHDAGVKIGGKAQIGNGHILIKDGSTLLVNQGINRRYTDAEWEAGHLILGDGDLPGVSDELKTSVQTMYANSLPECHSWEYKAPYAPYDKYAGTGSYDAKGGAKIATSGRAFNGNVFGGGSGFFPYEAGHWNPKAGQVEGDTWVEVTGGHIMTSLYGGSEMTSVTRDAHIIMSGGTVGVPRTLSEIAAHPVTCYVFGGGKGEERSYLDNVTTVNNAFVKVSGGWVYGSVFGGAEDGTVLGNAKVTIGGTTPSDATTFADLLAGSATKIGTWGTSYVDGNIFGGGRGYEGKNPKAGRVGGNIDIDITGGCMLGSVYGGGRLGSVGIDDTGTMQDGDNHGIITINATGGIIGNDLEYTYSPDAALLSGTLKNTVFEDFTFKEKIADGESTTTVDEAADAVTIKKLYHTKGGSIYGGSMGRLTQIDGVTINPNWHQLGIAKATTINFSGNARVMSSLFGGSEFGKVIGDTHINVSGSPVIGTAVEKAGVPQYTFGSIYAGGYGSDYKLTDADKTAGATVEPRDSAGLVGGNTYLNMSENAKVLASVYGGGKLAVVKGNTDVRVSGGEVGLNLVRKGDGYVMFGGDGMGNVYGGGRGRLVDGDPDNGLGLVKGNTNVTISGGSIYHNVYGGGTLASVGTFHVSDGTTPSYIPFAGVPYDWTANTGTATVTVTGGTIGINGRDNGMVFGSSRGDLTLPVVEGGREIDPYDRMAWVNDSRVNIGTDGSPTGPHITGTVYGGGENGHNGHDATVSVYSGTVGIVDTADPWYSFADAEVNEKALLTRGNVYGAGCGTDTYTKDGEELHNPKAGMVGHSTTVNIQGGHIVRNVYGGGALGSVGMLSSDEGTKHDNAATSFALSWPYALEFAPGEDNGKATVNVTGGHIGLRQLDGGDIFGGARGEAGDRYATAHLAYVRESEVNVNYPSTPDLDALTYSGIQNDFSVPCITGSVHGSGENGFVYDDAHVNIINGLIGHSVYGGGKGKGTYTKRLSNIGGVTGKDGSDHHDAEIYSLIAGKVFGNTYVTMKNGRVGRNIYGGGNMGSVGKGNYAGGADDYFPSGYGEAITGNLWTSEAVGDNAWHFLNSGNTHVKVFGGEVGYIDSTNPENSMKNDLPYGNVFGGSAGEAAPNILDDPRYEYCPAFFSGYVNETNVAIGGYRCKAACTDKNGAAHAVDELLSEAEVLELFAGTSALADGKPSDEYWEKLTGPTILASVYGGGQEGHVRRDTHVRVTSGEIGLAYTDANRTLLKTGSLSMSDELNNPQWLYRGNVFGGGSGITKYAYDFDYDGTTSTDANGDGVIEDSEVETATYMGAPVKEEDYSSSAGSVTRFTQVDITGGTIHRNVYGGGSVGSVGAPNLGQGYEPYKPGQANIDGKPVNGPGRQSLNSVTIGGGKGVANIGTPTDYNKVYGGEVYGAGRGNTKLDAEQFGSSVWTLVRILNGANIKGNVYGGGDSGMVKKNSEVIVGEKGE